MTSYEDNRAQVKVKVRSSPLLRVSFVRLARVTLTLPLFAFLACLAHATWTPGALRAATATHCAVWNFAPSVSSAVGAPGSARSALWRLCLALHSAPRALVAAMHWSNNLASFSGRRRRILAHFSFACNLVEVLSLLLLSVVPSKENYGIHKFGFVTFVLTASLFVLSHLRLTSAATPTERWIALCFFSSLAAALYLFRRHNAHCEPGVYSLFSICEYGVVLANMAFHYAAAGRFANRVLQI